MVYDRKEWKDIIIRKDTHADLKAVKEPKESFDDVIRALIEKCRKYMGK